MLINCCECDKPGPPDRCSACNLVYYCGAVCQKSNWKEHRMNCKSFAPYIQTEKEKDREETMLANQILDDKQDAAYKCSICSEDSSSSVLRMIECGHVFCYTCIRKSQMRNFGQIIDGSTCPICRTKTSFLEATLLSRSGALRTLAKACTSTEKRDKICTVALEEAASVLQVHPGTWSMWQAQGETYMAMEQYELAVESLHKAYNSHMYHLSDDVSGDPSPTNFLKGLEHTPSALLDVGALSHSHTEFFDGWGTQFCVVLSRAYIRNGNYQEARRLVDITNRINKPKVRYVQSDERQMDYDLLVLRAECCYHLGEYDESLMLAREAQHRRSFQPGLAKLMAQCTKELGDIDEAADIMGRGFFNEEPWNDKVKRENLKTWRELDAERTTQQQTSS